MPGARSVSFIDDIAVILPLELSLDMTAIGKVTEWLQRQLGVEGVRLNRSKSQALLAVGVGPEHPTEEQRADMDDTGLMVVRQEMRVVGVPVGTEQSPNEFGGGKWRASRACEGARPERELSDDASICRFPPPTPPSHSPALDHTPSCCKLRRFGGVGLSAYDSW